MAKLIQINRVNLWAWNANRVLVLEATTNNTASGVETPEAVGVGPESPHEEGKWTYTQQNQGDKSSRRLSHRRLKAMQFSR